MSVSILRPGIVKGDGTGIGRNLILNSAAYDGNINWNNWNNGTDRTIEYIDGKYWFHFKAPGSTTYGGYIQRALMEITANTKYTISATFFANSDDTAIFWFHWRSTEDPNMSNLSQSNKTFSITTTPTRYYWTVTSGTHATYAINRFNLMIGCYHATENNDFYITDIKFEEGEVATPWIPAEEDALFVASDHTFFEDSDITSIRKDHILSTEFIEI